MMNDELLTTAEASKHLRHSTRWLRQQIKAGTIRAIKDQRKLLIPMSPIERYCQEHLTS